MIIATAGHVDHGKSTLIKALTGVDTDRLAEEKRRGLSIDLGFAWLQRAGGEPLGFIDVPGHERFIGSMLAGVAAIDAALLVVAADQGVMPQTLEHMAILRLLGVSRIILVLSRCDLAQAEQQQVSEQAMVELLADHGWPQAPVFCVSSVTGQGIDALRGFLLAQVTVDKPVSGYARLMIDRRFSLAGAGCVITGTLISGSLQQGQRLIGPAGEVRVRSLQVASHDVSAVRAGQRCAVNLTGAIKSDQPQRGDWLTEVAFPTTTRLDVALRSLPDSHWHRGVLQLHIGTGVYPARVVRLEAEQEPALAQLMLEQPLQAVAGDRFIIRDPAANTTLGGGRVLDPQGLRRGRSKPARLALLRALQGAVSPQQALIAELQQGVIEPDELALRWNLTAAQLVPLLDAAKAERLSGPQHSYALLPEHIEQAWDKLYQRLSDWHRNHPEQLGPGEGELGLVSQLQMPLPLARLLLQRWQEQGRLLRQAWAWYLPSHAPQLSGEDQQLLAQVSVYLLDGGLRPPIVGELAQQLGIPLEALKAFLQRMQRAGELIAVAPNRYYLPSQVDGLVKVAQQLAAASASGSFDAAAYRDASGIGRNLSIQVLEYLDRAGVTRFARNQRYLAAG